MDRTFYHFDDIININDLDLDNISLNELITLQTKPHTHTV